MIKVGIWERERGYRIKEEMEKLILEKEKLES